MLSPAHRALALDFFRFGVVGTTGFFVDTAVVYATKGLIGLYAAGLLSYLVAATWTWAFNRHWTYAGQHTGPAWRQWLRFLVANLSGFALNRGLYALLVTISPFCRAYPVFAVAAGSILGLSANFLAARRLVFR